MSSLLENAQYDSEGNLVTSFNVILDEFIDRAERSEEIIEEWETKVENLKTIIEQSKNAIVKHERNIERKRKRTAEVETLLEQAKDVVGRLNADTLRRAKAIDAGEDIVGEGERGLMEAEWNSLSRRLKSTFQGRGKA